MKHGCLLSLLLVATTACEADTGGRRARFELALEPARDARRMFRTSESWDVTLTEACLAVGPIYLNAEPGLARGPSPLRGRLWELLVPSAHAHPGVDHFSGGEVRGEWTDQLALDLLGPQVSLGAREGIAGQVRSVSLGVQPPRPGTSASCLRGHHAYVVGVATRNGTTIAFEGGLDIDATGTKRRLVASGEVAIDDARRIIIALDPRPWLDRAQFDTLVADGSERRKIEPSGQVWGAWSLGLQTSGMIELRSNDSPYSDPKATATPEERPRTAP